MIESSTRIFHAKDVPASLEKALKKIPAVARPGNLWLVFLSLSEPVVHTGTKQPEVVAVLNAGDREVVVVEIDEEEFEPGAPVWSETEFGANARGPTGVGMSLREAERF